MRFFSYAKHFSVAFQRLLARHTPICSFILFNKGGWGKKHSQGRCGIDPYPDQDLKIPHSRHSPRLEPLGRVTPGVQDELAPRCYCLTPEHPTLPQHVVQAQHKLPVLTLSNQPETSLTNEKSS